MKNKVLYLVSLAILGVSSVKAQLNVGSTSAADASAILQATSTTKGFLPPVMTTTQRNAIATPAPGLLIFNSTTNQQEVNSGTTGTPVWGANTAATFYNADGTLATNRVVTQGANTLSYLGTGGIKLKSGTVNFDSSAIIGKGDSLSGGVVGVGITANGGLNMGQNTGGNNIYIGYKSGKLTTGAGDVFIGYQSGQSNTTGTSNTFSGYLSGVANTTGSWGTFIGQQSGQSNTTGVGNTFSGYFSGQGNTTGQSNVFSGYQSGMANTTGNVNTFIGQQSGQSNTTGSNNSALGYLAGPNSGALSNTTSIGYNVQTTVSNTVILGSGANVGIGTTTPATKLQVVSADNSTTTVIDVQANNLTQGAGIWYGGLRSTGSAPDVGLNLNAKGSGIININNSAQLTGNLTATGTITQNSDRRLKTNIVPLNSALAKVMQLTPYSYSKKASISATDYNVKEIGFMAQDIRKIFPDLVAEAKDSAKTLSVNYTALIPVLTKAIQEQQAQNDTQVAQIAVLTKANTSMAAQLADLKDMKIAMAAMQSELSKIALVNKQAAANTASK